MMRHDVPAALCRPAPIPLDQRLTWSAVEAAAVVGVSVRHIRAAISRGDLPAVRLGRRVLLDPADVRSWLDRSRCTGRPATV
jgi:excisionase family DNA binding protein